MEDESQVSTVRWLLHSILPSPQMLQSPLTTWTPPHHHHIRSFTQPVDSLASFLMQLKPPVMHSVDWYRLGAPNMYLSYIIYSLHSAYTCSSHHLEHLPQ